MIPFYRKIRKNLLSSGQPETLSGRLLRYLLYALGEILLVVVGILIALKINNWNNRSTERADEIESYRKIRRQVADDKENLAGVKAFNLYYAGQYARANQIIGSEDLTRMDTLALMTLGLSQYSDFLRSANIYETLVNSGALRLLQNDEITSGLQKLEMTYNHVNKLEEIHWDIIMKEVSPELRGVINYATLQVMQPERLYSVEMRNLFIESMFLTQAKDSVYNKALSEIQTIVDLIDGELQQP